MTTETKSKLRPFKSELFIDNETTPVQTVDGRPVRILNPNKQHKRYTVIGDILDGIAYTSCEWTSTGAYFANGSSALDLVFADSSVPSMIELLPDNVLMIRFGNNEDCKAFADMLLAYLPHTHLQMDVEFRSVVTLCLQLASTTSSINKSSNLILLNGVDSNETMLGVIASVCKQYLHDFDRRDNPLWYDLAMRYVKEVKPFE